MRAARHHAARTALAVAAFALVAFGALARSGGPPALVPANFTWKTDALGFRWDLNQSGQINDGLNDCFDGAMRLTVNGQQFNSMRPQMTADGSEYVLSANVAGLQVTRRIKVDLTAAAVRYVEVLRNNGGAPVTATLAVTSNLGNSCQATVTSSGSRNVRLLGPKDSGLVGVQSPGQPRPSVVWGLAGPASRVKPSVNIRNNYTYVFTYSLSVPAGKTVAVVHTVAQRRFATVPDAKTLAPLYKTFNSRAWTKDLPRDIRQSIVNLGRAVMGAGLMPDLAKMLDGLGLVRGGADVLAFGPETRLAGTAACDSLTVRTRHGRATVPFEDVAAVTGKLRGGRARVYTRDGRIYAGELEAADLRFTMNSGPALRLTVERLDVLLTRADPADGRPREGACAAVDTFDGNRLTVVPPRAGGVAPALTLVTPWGRRRVPLDEVRWIRPAEGGTPGHVAALKDGSRFFGFLAGEGVTLETVEFGPQRFQPGEIRAVENLDEARRRREARERPGAGGPGAADPDGADEGELTEPHVVLAGENVIVGYIDLDEIHVAAQGAPVPLPPNQLRSLHNCSDEDTGGGAEGARGLARFRAELWGGGVVVGTLREAELPFRAGEWVVRVPVADVVDVFVPTPTVPDALRDRIASAIRGLGHPDWKEREKASRALEEFGHVAKSQLKAAFKESSDPEVQRRAKALLDKIEEPALGAGGGARP
jgi:hypothetical protein